MFDVEVKVITQDDESYRVSVDLLGNQITSEDAIEDYVREDIGLEDIEFSIKVSNPVECSLGDAFEYVEWTYGASQRDADGIVEAAAYLGIPASQIDETYQGYYDSAEDFVEQVLEQMGVEIPSWLVVDSEGTWNQSLRYDYAEHNGHYFYNV